MPYGSGHMQVLLQHRRLGTDSSTVGGTSISRCASEHGPGTSSRANRWHRLRPAVPVAPRPTPPAVLPRGQGKAATDRRGAVPAAAGRRGGGSVVLVSQWLLIFGVSRALLCLHI